MRTRKRRRLASVIVSYPGLACDRFNLSDCDIEDILAERGTTVSGSTPSVSETESPIHTEPLCADRSRGRRHLRRRTVTEDGRRDVLCRSSWREIRHCDCEKL